MIIPDFIIREQNIAAKKPRGDHIPKRRHFRFGEFIILFFGLVQEILKIKIQSQQKQKHKNANRNRNFRNGHSNFLPVPEDLLFKQKWNVNFDNIRNGKSADENRTQNARSKRDRFFFVNFPCRIIIENRQKKQSISVSFRCERQKNIRHKQTVESQNQKTDLQWKADDMIEIFEDLNIGQTHYQCRQQRQHQSESRIVMIVRDPKRKIPNDIKEIIGQRMSLKTTARLNNRSVIETKVTIPRNPVVIDNREIICDKPSVGAISDHEKQKDKTFGLGGWENDLQKG